jgi:hypothetical protein
MSVGRFLLACVAVAAVAAPAAAQARPPQLPPLPPQARVQGDMILLEGAVPSKEQALAQVDAYVDALLAPEIAKQQAEAAAAGGRTYGSRRTSGRRLLIHGSTHLTGYGRLNRSCSYMYASFDDTVSHPFFETSATVSGSSRTAWLGTCPFNAEKVTLKDTICLDAVGFSISVGGAGFSSSGGGCGSWSGSVTNNWQITHVYSGVHGSCACAIWRVRQSSAGTYKFGTTFYTVTANGSLLI